MIFKKMIGFVLLLITLLLGTLVWADQMGRSRYNPRQSRIERIWNSQLALARGGRLYDNWFEVAGISPPQQAHPAYPRRAKQTNAAATWRCTTCHGWSYQGGINNQYGLRNMREAPTATIVAVLKKSLHGFAGKMVARDLEDLALFISKGQLNMNRYIDRRSGRIIGASTLRGRAYYQTLCINCHGAQGHKLDKKAPLGELANKNPWRTLHKILNGQANTNMPALRTLGVRMPAPWGSRKLMVPVDVLAYLQTLPGKR